MSNWFERAGNLLHGLRRRRQYDSRMRWSRDQLLAYQRDRLAAIVGWASTHSAFYRELYGGLVEGSVELGSLPTVSKDAMMNAFDRFVTDPRLRLTELVTHVERVVGDDLYRGEFRVMTSSGSSGRKAVYVYDRAAWRDGLVAGGLRMTRLAGISPGLPRPRFLNVAAPDGKHMTFRGSRSIEVGLFSVRRRGATEPLRELCAAAAAYRPDVLVGYPSVLALIAEEQRGGRLAIAPRVVITSSEVQAPAMAQAMRDAWGLVPFNCLGLTETGIAAMDCEHHDGLHVFEDLVIIEVVDARGRAVPPRTPGAKIYVTNLYNRVQPIIRFEVSDLVTIDDTPCACGATFARIVSLDGRSDDVLVLPGPDGPVRIHPIHLRGALAAAGDVLQYQVVDRDHGLDVQVVLATNAAPESARSLAARLETVLRAQGAHTPVHVRAVTEIPREQGAGKLKHVRTERTDRRVGS